MLRLTMIAALFLSLALPPMALAEDPVKLDPAKLPKLKLPDKIANGEKPIRVKVLVLEFNPIIPANVHAPGDKTAKPLSVRELGGWNDCLTLAAGYMQDVCDASGGIVQYEIVEWIDTRSFHKKVDGFVYTPEEYVRCVRNQSKWHEPDGADYAATFEDYKIVPRVERGEIDEVWFFGAPYFGYWESAMAGQGAFYINGGVLGDVKCKRPFAIMGFNYERGVAEMLHDLCHRTESTMSRVYGGWEADKLTSNWARFAANYTQSNGVAAVGTCHWPPNAEKDYDYANPREVQSSADAWLNYPRLGDEKKPVTCETWREPYKNSDGRSDYHRNYMRWWFTHLPKAPGVNDDGRVNNWWRYIFDYWRYDEQGKLLQQH